MRVQVTVTKMVDIDNQNATAANIEIRIHPFKNHKIIVITFIKHIQAPWIDNCNINLYVQVIINTNNLRRKTPTELRTKLYCTIIIQ